MVEWYILPCSLHGHLEVPYPQVDSDLKSGPKTASGGTAALGLAVAAAGVPESHRNHRNVGHVGLGKLGGQGMDCTWLYWDILSFHLPETFLNGDQFRDVPENWHVAWYMCRRTIPRPVLNIQGAWQAMFGRNHPDSMLDIPMFSICPQAQIWSMIKYDLSVSHSQS